MKGEPLAEPEPPGTIGFEVPQVLSGAPGWPGPFGLGLASAPETPVKANAEARSATEMIRFILPPPTFRVLPRIASAVRGPTGCSGQASDWITEMDEKRRFDRKRQPEIRWRAQERSSGEEGLDS